MKKIAGASHIDEALVKEVARDIQRALLQADVNVKLVLELTKNVGGGPSPRSLSRSRPKEHVIRSSTAS